MYFKKKTTLFLMILLVFTLLFSTSLFADNNKQKEVENSLKIEQDIQAVQNLQIIKEKIKGSKDEKRYAGAYIDEDGYLNVNFVSEVESIKEKAKLKNTKYHSVEFALEHLEELMEAVINDESIIKDISMVELSQKDNSINIYLKELEDSKAQKIKKTLDTPAIKFKKQELEFVTTTTVEIINQNVASFSSTNPLAGPTIGVGAVRNSDNKRVFITAGHITNAIGSNVYYNGALAGTLKAKAFGGVVDGSLVEPKNTIFTTYWPTKKFRDYGDTYHSAVYDSNQIIQGMSVRAYGAVSGYQTGTILSTSVAAWVDANGQQVLMTDQVRSNYKAINGDSGAAVVYFRQIQVFPEVKVWSVMSLQSSATLDQNGNWIPGVSTSLSSKIHHIFNALDVRDII
jgi:hypothetical protein